jgi:hypothetical protein
MSSLPNAEAKLSELIAASDASWAELKQRCDTFAESEDELKILDPARHRRGLDALEASMRSQTLADDVARETLASGYIQVIEAAKIASNDPREIERYDRFLRWMHGLAIDAPPSGKLNG